MMEIFCSKVIIKSIDKKIRKIIIYIKTNQYRGQYPLFNKNMTFNFIL